MSAKLTAVEFAVCTAPLHVWICWSSVVVKVCLRFSWTPKFSACSHAVTYPLHSLLVSFSEDACAVVSGGSAGPCATVMLILGGENVFLHSMEPIVPLDALRLIAKYVYGLEAEPVEGLVPLRQISMLPW